MEVPKSSEFSQVLGLSTLAFIGLCGLIVGVAEIPANPIIGVGVVGLSLAAIAYSFNQVGQMSKN